MTTHPLTTLSEHDLDASLKRLNLATVRRLYRDVVTRAEQDQWTFRDFLAVLVAEEVAHRTQTRVQAFTRQARFPFLKTIEEFDFSLQSTLRAALLGSYLSADFVTEGRSLIFLGATGRGKTHLAVAIGYRAIQLGFETRFTTAAQLIEDLSNASRHGRLHDALLRYTHPHVLIVDEVGYLSYGPDAANVLYHVVNDRHLRKRPMIFTTNKPLQKWGRVLHDRDLAAAILDWVLERGRVIVLDGPSGRTKHLALEDPAAPASHASDSARISGIQPPQFLEPTAGLCSRSFDGRGTLAIFRVATKMYRHLLGPDFHRLRRFTLHGTRRTVSGIKFATVSSPLRLNDEKLAQEGAECPCRQLRAQPSGSESYTSSAKLCRIRIAGSR